MRARLLADASSGAGLGHLARCTALACALATRGFEVEALGLGAREAIELDGVRWEPWRPDGAAPRAAPDLLVLDTYDRDEWQRLAAPGRRLLAAFEDAVPDLSAADVSIAPVDASDSPAGADVTIAPVGASAATGGSILSGLRFACLRRPFWDLGPRQVRDSPERVLLTTGGGDLGGLAGRLARHLRECLPGVELELVWGPGFGGEPPQGVTVLERPPSLLEPLLRADAVVCAGGQTLLEAAATGAPALALEGAPNQRPQIAALAERGAVLAVREEEVPGALEDLLASAAARRRLSGRAREAVDGRGALRVAAELEAITGGG